MNVPEDKSREPGGAIALALKGLLPEPTGDRRTEYWSRVEGARIIKIAAPCALMGQVQPAVIRLCLHRPRHIAQSDPRRMDTKHLNVRPQAAATDQETSSILAGEIVVRSSPARAGSATTLPADVQPLASRFWLRACREGFAGRTRQCRETCLREYPSRGVPQMLREAAGIGGCELDHQGLLLGIEPNCVTGCSGSRGRAIQGCYMKTAAAIVFMLPPRRGQALESQTDTNSGCQSTAASPTDRIQTPPCSRVMRPAASVPAASVTPIKPVCGARPLQRPCW